MNFSEAIHGFYAVPALSLLGELGLLDRWLAGEVIDVAAFCREQGLDAQIVQASIDYLRFHGHLTIDDERGGVVPTETGRDLLGKWPLAMIHFAYTPLLGEIVPLARREKRYGFGEAVYRNMVYDTKGSGLVGYRGGRFQRVVDYLRKRSARRLLDLGCGDGTFLAYACEQFPSVEAIGVDQSPVSLESARKSFERRNLGGRGTFLQGDLRQPETFVHWDELRGVDVVTIWFILHELTYDGVEPAVHVLETLHRRLPEATLAVTEVFRLPEGDLRRYADRGIVEMTLMHDLSRQRMLLREQWLDVFLRAGLTVKDRIVHLAQEGAAPAMETMMLGAASP